MEKAVSKDGTVIAFDRYGSGPAVILVGGMFQHRAIDPQTAQLAKTLGKQFTVFHYDRRGRGDSSDTLPYAVEREVEDLDALVQQAGGSAFAFGMSSGAALVLEAKVCGVNLQKLALYEPPFNTDDGSRQEIVETTRQLHALLAEDRRREAVVYTLTGVGMPPEAIAGMQQAPIWSRFESVAPTIAYDHAILGDGSVPVKRLASIQVPTLVIDGTDTYDFMHAAAQMVADAIPNARRLRLEGQTHNVDPDVLAPVLIEFFNR